MSLLEEEESGEQVVMKNESYLQILRNKDQRKRLVHEIFSFLDSSQSVQEIDALRAENRKLKNANSRLRYKTRGWALRKEEYENEIERLSGKVSSYFDSTDLWCEELKQLGGPADKGTPMKQTKDTSTQTEGACGAEERTVATQTGEESWRMTSVGGRAV